MQTGQPCLTRAIGKAILLPCLTILFNDAAVADPLSWDWQLSEPYDLSRDIRVIDIDPDNHAASDIAALNARGVQTICYVSVGTIEKYRDDVAAFPAEVLGNIYNEWPDERFLDIRRRDILIPLMTARFQWCHDMGFTAVEPDNQDVYDNTSGFDISAEETLAYLRDLADVAHGMGLEIGQKNVSELTPRLVSIMDFAVAEDCFADNWCGDLLPYVQMGKPIYAAEYDDTGVDFAAACAYGREAGIAFIQKDRDLTAALTVCG